MLASSYRRWNTFAYEVFSGDGSLSYWQLHLPINRVRVWQFARSYASWD